MIEQLKQTRVELDAIHGICIELKGKTISATFGHTSIIGGLIPTHKAASNETLEAAKYIRSARKWIGKLLHYLGDTSPYKKDGERKTIADIEDEADKSLPVTLQVQVNPNKPIGTSTRPYTHIESVDWLRVELDKHISFFEEIYEVASLMNLEKLRKRGSVANTREAAICRTRIWSDLQDAKMMLGEELGRIKKQG